MVFENKGHLRISGVPEIDKKNDMRKIVKNKKTRGDRKLQSGFLKLSMGETRSPGLGDYDAGVEKF